MLYQYWKIVIDGQLTKAYFADGWTLAEAAIIYRKADSAEPMTESEFNA